MSNTFENVYGSPRYRDVGRCGISFAAVDDVDKNETHIFRCNYTETTLAYVFIVIRKAITRVRINYTYIATHACVFISLCRLSGRAESGTRTGDVT